MIQGFGAIERCGEKRGAKMIQAPPVTPCMILEGETETLRGHVAVGSVEAYLHVSKLLPALGSGFSTRRCPKSIPKRVATSPTDEYLYSGLILGLCHSSNQ